MKRTIGIFAAAVLLLACASEVIDERRVLHCDDWFVGQGGDTYTESLGGADAGTD